MRRHAPLLLVLLATLACARHSEPRAQQSLAPGTASEPMMACVDSALTASPHVGRIEVPASGRDRARVRSVQLLAPPGPRIQFIRFAVEPRRGTPRQFAVNYWTPGASGMGPSGTPEMAYLERQAVAEIGIQILRGVRARCAPTAPGEPTCPTVSAGRGARCTAGA